MEYIELKVTFPQAIEEEEAGIVIAALADMGFESFQHEDALLSAYIQTCEYDLNCSFISDYIDELKSDGVRCDLSKVQTVNWNALWESNFHPIEVGKQCCIRAPFHQPSSAQHDVIIMPKMSFGTGHHATTYLMVETLFDLDLAAKKGLDMGCGTGVLAILALQLGAGQMDAIDIDSWAVENARENAVVNRVEQQITIEQGDAALLQGRCYDFILANINRNILLADMAVYANTLSCGGEIVFSGFLQPDVADIISATSTLGMELVATKERDGWQLVRVRKII